MFGDILSATITCSSPGMHLSAAQTPWQCLLHLKDTLTFSAIICFIHIYTFCLSVQESLMKMMYHQIYSVGYSRFAMCLLGLNHQDFFLILFFFHELSHILQKRPLIFPGSSPALLKEPLYLLSPSVYKVKSERCCKKTNNLNIHQLVFYWQCGS